MTLGTHLLPQHVASAAMTSSPLVQILDLLLGLKRLGNMCTDGDNLSICCLNGSLNETRNRRGGTAFSAHSGPAVKKSHC